MDDGESLWGTPQVASYYGVPVATIYGWRTKGEGPRAIRVGKPARYRRADVEAWLDQHADEQQPA